MLGVLPLSCSGLQQRLSCPVSSSPRASQLDPTSAWDLLHPGCWPHVLWGAQHVLGMVQWRHFSSLLPGDAASGSSLLCAYCSPCVLSAWHRVPASIQRQPVLLCSPVCLLGYHILSPCTDKEAIILLSFIPMVKLFTRAACFVQEGLTCNWGFLLFPLSSHVKKMSIHRYTAAFPQAMQSRSSPGQCLFGQVSPGSIVCMSKG